MVSSHIGGKLLLFQSSVPSLGVGRVKNRENPSAYGTEREPGLRNPDDPFYKRYAAECSRVQVRRGAAPACLMDGALSGSEGDRSAEL